MSTNNTQEGSGISAGDTGNTRQANASGLENLDLHLHLHLFLRLTNPQGRQIQLRQLILQVLKEVKDLVHHHAITPKDQEE